MSLLIGDKDVLCIVPIGFCYSAVVFFFARQIKLSARSRCLALARSTDARTAGHIHCRESTLLAHTHLQFYGEKFWKPNRDKLDYRRHVWHHKQTKMSGQIIIETGVHFDARAWQHTHTHTPQSVCSCGVRVGVPHLCGGRAHTIQKRSHIVLIPDE